MKKHQAFSYLDLKAKEDKSKFNYMEILLTISHADFHICSQLIEENIHSKSQQNIYYMWQFYNKKIHTINVGILKSK